MANILPVSDLRNYNEVLKNCHKGEPVYLTKNGRGRFVVMDIEDYERDRAEKKLLLKLQEAEEAVKDGEGWLDLDELKALVPKSHMGWPKYIFMNLIRCSLSVTFPRKTAISFFSVNFFLSRTKIKCLILLSFIITPFPLFSVIRRLFEMDGIGGTKSTSPAHRFNRSCWENQRV